MPIKPGKDETHDEWMSRCVPEMMGKNGGTKRPNDVAVAACYSMWNEDKKQAKQVGDDDIVPDDDEDEDDFMERCIEETGDEDQCAMIWSNSPMGMSAGKNVVHKTHSAEVMVNNEFILSDASIDRYGDSVNPDGWVIDNFNKNPIALFNHNPDFPIGRWVNVGVRDKSLRSRLELAPKGTSPRIDEIRKLREAGILNATSVGFLPLEAKPRAQGQMGQHYLRQELVEASLVAVPANPNALAVAKSLKVSDETMKLVFGKSAAEGQPSGVVTKRGKSAGTRAIVIRNGKMNLAQRIQETEARIVKFRDELDKHMQTVDDENPTEESTTITKELTEKIAKQQQSLDALKGAESRLVVATANANGNGKNGEAEGTGSAVIVRSPRPFAAPIKKVNAVDHLWRSVVIALKLHDEKGGRTIDQILKSTYGDNDLTNITRVVMQGMVTKASTIPADTTTTGWATELVQTVIGEFIDALMPLSIYPKLAAKGGSFTFGRNGVISLPSRQATPTIAGSFVAQGAPIPVRQGAFTPITLTPKKMGVITTLTREITEHSTPSIEGIVRQAILEDTAVSIDTILIDANAATTTRPAGLKSGVSKTPPTSGGGIAAVIGDLKALTGALITATKGNLRAPCWIMNPADALAVSLTQAAAGGAFPFLDEINAGTMLGYSLITSATCPVDTMFLVDAADFMTATGDTPRFDVSDQAVLHMEDTAPAQIGTAGTPPVVAAPTRSLWQTDTIGIRMIMDINWAMRRTGSVQWTDTMTWN